MARRRKKIKVFEKKLGRSKAWGMAYIGDNIIEIDSSLKGKKRLKILLHEIYHHFDPSASESKVLAFERYVGNFIWDQGYRWVDQRLKKRKTRNRNNN